MDRALGLFQGLSFFYVMKPVGPEQIQDTHEHDHVSLCVGNLKKYKRMKGILTFNEFI
ncbi:MAG: hypothetical protein MI975_28865 [Cytophagales bacterium]|nr:hypothetical protein [Cytophagales bacterium]